MAGDATLAEAAGVLTAKKVGAVVVTEQGGALVGVLSERDIIREIARNGAGALNTTVAAAMTKAVITVAPDESVDQGLARMTDRRVRHLPVLAQGRLIGIVSIGDLVKHKIDEAEKDAAALREYIAAG